MTRTLGVTQRETDAERASRASTLEGMNEAEQGSGLGQQAFMLANRRRGGAIARPGVVVRFEAIQDARDAQQTPQ